MSKRRYSKRRPAAVQRQSSPRPTPLGDASRGLSEPAHALLGGQDSIHISACLIVKDEERNIARCLSSLRPLVDEVIVVDTGSSDRTAEIAREFGASVHHFAWCDDFAAARNASIERASGEWVVWVDADEELMEQTPGSLRRLCSVRDSSDGYLVSCKSLSNELGDIGTIIRQFRLFRNHRGLRFDGRIHEHLIPPGSSRQVQLIPQEDVWIRHWGYIPTGDVLKRKRDRNFPLLQLSAAEHPDDPFIHYNLGKQYNAEHRFEPGLEALRKAIDLWTRQGQTPYAFVGNMFALAINAAVELGENELAIEIEALTPAMFRSSDVLFQAGVALMRLQRLDEAMERLNRAWQDPVAAAGIEVDPSSSTWRPLGALTHIYVETGRLAEAYATAKRAYELAPTRPNILYALAFVCGRMGHTDEAARWARELIAGELDEGFKSQARRILVNIGRGTGNAGLVLEAFSGPIHGLTEEEAVAIRAEAHAQAGNLQAQYDTLDAGCRQFPSNSSIRLALAAVLESQGYVQPAINVLSAGLDQPAPSSELYQRLGVLLAKAGRLEDAANAFTLAAIPAAEHSTEAVEV